MQIETLEMEIKHIKDDMSEMKSDIRDIKENIFEKLDDRYPTRREFNAIKRVLWIFISLFTIVTTLLQFIK